jgi:hypothetical protein
VLGVLVCWVCVLAYTVRAHEHECVGDLLRVVARLVVVHRGAGQPQPVGEGAVERIELGGAGRPKVVGEWVVQDLEHVRGSEPVRRAGVAHTPPHNGQVQAPYREGKKEVNVGSWDPYRQ